MKNIFQKLRRLKDTVREKLSGDMQLLELRYSSLYGSGESTRRAEEARKKISVKYILAAVIFGMMLILSAAGGDDGAEIFKSSDGKSVYVIRPDEKSDPAVLDMEMTVDGEKGRVVRKIQIVIDPKNSGEVNENGSLKSEKSESYSEKIEGEMKSAVRSVNGDTKADRVKLPTELAGGEKVSWRKAESSDAPLMTAGFIMVLFVIYRTRYRGLEKEEREAKESVIRELPEFINKVILLLNAGMVLNSVFITIMENREKAGPAEDSYFYSQLRSIYIKVSRANGSLDHELRSFAKRSGVRELMRFSNIVGDNISKGADLTGKLRRESEALWFARKKQSEEMGRTAETKLTFPMVILLLVLVIVSVAPAMLEM